MSRLDDVLERVGAASDLDGLNRAIVALRDHFDTEHVVYHAVRTNGSQWAALTYDEGWAETYVAEGFQNLDPVVQSAFRTAAPVDWKALDWSPKQARMLLGEAIASGLGNQGFSLPIHGPGGRFALFTINHRANDGEWSRFRAEHLEDVLLAAHYVNERAMALEGRDAMVGRALSPRETDALALLAAGYSRADAAERLKISEHTLRAYIEGARDKLGAANTIHAVATAMARGLIGL